MTDQTTPETGVRKAKLVLDAAMIRHLFGVPASTTIAAVQVEQDPARIEIILHGPDLPLVPVDSVAPFAHVHGNAIEHEGKRFFCNRLVVGDRELVAR